MIAVKTADITQNFKQIADNIFKHGEKVLISRPRNENLVLITESEYNMLDKARQNVEYLAKLDRAIENTREDGGFEFDIVTRTFSETPQKVNI